eukprot:gene360-189_t
MAATVIGHFKLRVGAATAKPSPAVGQALGPLGINMAAFCKEFNERTKQVRPEVPLQVMLIPKSDKTFQYSIRSPETKWFVHRVARVPLAGWYGNPERDHAGVGCITLKEVYHIAKAKSADPQYVGVPLRAICIAVIGTAKGMGVKVRRELPVKFSKRDEIPVWDLERLRKDLKMRNKQARKSKK